VENIEWEAGSLEEVGILEEVGQKEVGSLGEVGQKEVGNLEEAREGVGRKVHSSSRT
jgi:hypothetical protein